MLPKSGLYRESIGEPNHVHPMQVFQEDWPAFKVRRGVLHFLIPLWRPTIGAHQFNTAFLMLPHSFMLTQLPI